MRNLTAGPGLTASEGVLAHVAAGGQSPDTEPANAFGKKKIDFLKNFCPRDCVFCAKERIFAARNAANPMVERIQYLLILLLFVLAGSLDGVSFRDGAHGVQPVLTRSTDSDASDTVRNQLSAWTHSCDFAAETPVVSFDHKYVVRQRAAVRSAVETVFGVRIASSGHSEVSSGDAVDYYVFSLGRILI